MALNSSDKNETTNGKWKNKQVLFKDHEGKVHSLDGKG
jgi:hypothetical protein